MKGFPLPQATSLATKEVARLTTNAPALIDWLVNAFSNAVTLGGPVVSGTQTGPVTVFDGPRVTGLDPFLKLYVGLADPDNEGIEPAATITQKRDDLGRLARTEQTDINCCAEAWSGDTDIQAVRLAASGILAAAEQIIRADTTNSGGLAQATPGLSAGGLLQNNTAGGAIARWSFTISFTSFT